LVRSAGKMLFALWS